MQHAIEPVVEPPSTAVIALAPTSVDHLLTAAIERGATVEALERIMSMRRELKAEQAREAFVSALAAFQGECPVIHKSKAVLVNGSPRYHYAPLECIVAQVKELLQRHGLSYTLNAVVEDKWVTAKCSITHREGHTEVSEFKVPIEAGAKMSEPQKFASALTFAKRYAFCNALGILTGDEDDDNQVAVPPEQMARKIAQDKTAKPQSEEAVRDFNNRVVQFEAFCNQHSQAVNEFFRSIKWLGPDEVWQTLGNDKLHLTVQSQATLDKFKAKITEKLMKESK